MIGRKLSEMDGKELKLTYYCEPDVCILVGRDRDNNVYILAEEENKEGKEGA